MPENGFTLRDGIDLARITDEDLWIRYIGVGGSGSRAELMQSVADDSPGDPHEHNLIAQAINEHFIDGGGDHPVAYRDISGPAAGEPL